MRKHENYEEKGNVLQLKFLIPLVVIVLGFLAFNFLARDRRPEPIVEQLPAAGTETASEMPQAGPVPVVDDEGGTWLTNQAGTEQTETPVTTPDAVDQFAGWGDRVKQFGFQAGASNVLRRSVEKYGASREYQCSGSIVVKTTDTALNIRSGPATTNPVVAKATKGAAYPVLMWANDEGNSGSRWFLLVDDRRKVVRGWVSGEYCDTGGVSFAN